MDLRDDVPMLASEPLTVLLANNQADEVKLTTISMRAFYPGCRVEAVYSAEEALEWASKQRWQVLLVDQGLPVPSGVELVPALRQRAPHAAIIVQAEHTEPAAAVHLLRNGADYVLHKQSPAFYAEIPLLARELLEKRDLRMKLELAQERYQALQEHISDLVYELDPKGRILHVTPALAACLGYRPDELAGQHFSQLIHPEDRATAEGRFNERRASARSAEPALVRLVVNPARAQAADVLAFEISATGLYGRDQEFIGTLGVARYSGNPPPRRLSEEPEEASPEALHPEAAAPQPPRVGARRLHEVLPPSPPPFSVTQPVEAAAVARPAVTAPQPAPTSATSPHKPVAAPVAINRVMEEVLTAKAKDLQTHAILVEPRLTQELPLVLGDSAKLKQVLLALVGKAELSMWQANRGGQLRLMTRLVEAGEPAVPHGLPASPGESSYVLLEVTEPGTGVQDVSRFRREARTPVDAWDHLDRIVREHGGVLVSERNPAGGIRVRLQLPGWTATPAAHRKAPHGARPIEGQASAFAREAVATLTEVVREREVHYPERRRSPRFELALETRVTHQSSSWTGTAVSMSLHGLYVLTDAAVPAAELGQVQLGFASEVGVVELPGAIRATREVPPEASGTGEAPRLGIAIEFDKMGPVESRILPSMLESLCTRSVNVRLTVMLIPKETGDLLLEVTATSTDAVFPDQAITPSTDPGDSTVVERRLASRVNASIPVCIESFEAAGAVSRQDSMTVNLSAGGAQIRLSGERTGERTLVGQRVLLRLSSPVGFPPPGAGGGSPAPACTVTGQIVWARPDSQSKPARVAGLPFCAGIRFLPLNDEAQQRLGELIGQFLTSSVRLEKWAEHSTLTSDLKECRNTEGKRIVMYHDHPRATLPPGSPLAVLCPGYGETKKEHIPLAYYLASNGFHVLRFDYTNHVGESDGGVEHFTVSGMGRDLRTVLDYAEATWPASPIAIVTNSLGGRAALKAITEDRRPRLLILLTPVVDVQATLLAVHQEDLFKTYLAGVRRGVTNVLGFNVDLDRYCEDLLQEGYSDLGSTLRDAERATTPVILFAAEQDTWVRPEAVRAVRDVLGSQLRHYYLIPEALHRLHENPRKARAVFRQLVRCCLDEFYPLAPGDALTEPLQKEIGLQNRLERERARAHHQMAKAENQEFWRDYLDHFHYVVNFSDYWHLLDHIYRLTGTCERGELILDAGCGNGNFGMFLIINQAYRQRHSSRIDAKPPVYVGTDFVPSALVQARTNLKNVQASVWAQFTGLPFTQSALSWNLCRADLNLPLPFRDNQFDRIVSNLVIGYLTDPLFTLREFMRILCTNGRLVLTNLKPNADLSQIYRNFVEATQRPEEVEEARQLLSNSGKIKQGESDGIFRFLDKQELGALLVAAGGTQPRIYTTFANQAYLAVVEKPERPRSTVVPHVLSPEGPQA